jgi:DNA polymerase I-like protein with 3'-5' exonuclease and polymerase domains
VWLRGLIKPGEGSALAYIDWRSQEVAIAAALSGDSALWDAVQSGDVYLAFAKMAGLAPPDATKESHKRIRDMCKTCVLGINYGMGADALALRTGLGKREAAALIQRLMRMFPAFAEWMDITVSRAQLQGYLSMRLGWTLKTAAHHRPTSQRNFPIQGNGNEMLRLACSLGAERGVKVCAPVHDAVLIEAGADRINDAVLAMQAAMAEASRVVLGGLAVDTDVKVISWPDRYADDRGRAMWARVMNLLNALGLSALSALWGLWRL